MSFLFNEILYKPFVNLLLWTYEHVVSDFGIAIVLITILIRFILLPIFYKSAKDQTILQKIAPQIREIQKKHKENKEQQVQEMMKVYKEHRVNPFSSILLLLVQLPILFALYRVFVSGISEENLSLLYSFVAVPADLHYTFLGLIDLASPYVPLVLVTAAAQFVQSWLLLRVTKRPMPDSSGNPAMQAAERMSRKMIYFMPIVTGIILFQLPAAVAVYWLTTSVFSAIQQLVINKTVRKDVPVVPPQSNGTGS